jgi:hypothetical protein
MVGAEKKLSPDLVYAAVLFIVEGAGVSGIADGFGRHACNEYIAGGTGSRCGWEICTDSSGCANEAMVFIEIDRGKSSAAIALRLRFFNENQKEGMVVGCLRG